MSKMTDAERRKLIDKLNRETEEFIREKQEKNKGYKYDDGFTDDNIDEILATHPAFMTKQPTAEEIENNPLLKGLQQIQYDPDDSPYDKAIAYKNDGNFQFKVKKYKLACAAYTEAIKAKCTDVELLTILYTNRAAANFHLKNYRSSLIDASEAVQLSPDRVKSLVRCAQSCEALKRYQDAIDWCKVIISLEEDNKIANEIMNNCVKEKKIYERNIRKKAMLKEKEKRRNQSLINAIKRRNINLKIAKQEVSSAEEDNDAFIISTFASYTSKNIQVHLNGSDELIWPVLFAYPEFKTTDFIEEFHEDATFYDHLFAMFEKPPEWDVEGHYKVDKLQVFYENTEQETLYEVPVGNTLRDILSHSSYLVQAGTPNFFILSNASDYLNTFRSKWKKIFRI